MITTISELKDDELIKKIRDGIIRKLDSARLLVHYDKEMAAGLTQFYLVRISSISLSSVSYTSITLTHSSCQLEIVTSPLAVTSFAKSPTFPKCPIAIDIPRYNSGFILDLTNSSSLYRSTSLELTLFQYLILFFNTFIFHLFCFLQILCAFMWCRDLSKWVNCCFYLLDTYSLETKNGDYDSYLSFIIP